MASTKRRGTRQEFRFARQFAKSLRGFRYEFHLVHAIRRLANQAYV